MRLIWVVIPLVLIGIVGVQESYAIEGDQLLTIDNPTPEYRDGFGFSTASTPDGNFLIGAYFDHTGITNSGSAYLINATTGDVLLTINNPTPKFHDFFGYSVASTPEGNLLISSYLNDVGATDSGSVYLFDGITGELLLTINNPTPEKLDSFGWSIASTPNGDFLISSSGDNAGASSAGSVYLFDGITGELLLTINNPTPEKSEYFGYSVASTPEGNLLIGARNANSVYLFDGITGELLLTINNPRLEKNDLFGKRVASTPNGDLLVGTCSPEIDSGHVYLFDGITGELLLTINNPTPEYHDHFGCAVESTPNGDLLIGSLTKDTVVADAGAAYLFDGITGKLLLTINNPTPKRNEQFGISVTSTPNGNLLIGDNGWPISDPKKATGGTVYLFEGPPTRESFTDESKISVIKDGNGMVFQFVSPKKQLESDIASNDIICNKGLQLIFKSDNSPACVKPATAEKLIQRGWASS